MAEDRLRVAETVLEKNNYAQVATAHALIDIAHTLRDLRSLLDTQINGA